MSGFGGVLALELAGGFEAADAFLGRLRYARRSASLGGVDSLAVHPASMWRGMLSERADRRLRGPAGPGPAGRGHRGHGRPGRRRARRGRRGGRHLTAQRPGIRSGKALITVPRSRAFMQVDVFSATPYLGNPVAVILDGTDLTTRRCSA